MFPIDIYPTVKNISSSSPYGFNINRIKFNKFNFARRALTF